MNYDGFLLACVAAELQAALAGGRITKIRQPVPTDVFLIVRSHGKEFRLLLSVDAQYPRVHLTASVPPSPQNPSGFCMALRKHIQGGFITSVEQAGFDRILILHIEAPDGNRTKLIHEIMGKHSNLMLVDDSGRILAAAKVVTAAISRERQIIPGRDYIPPPSGSKVNPLLVTVADFNILLAKEFGELVPELDRSTLRGWLVGAFAGFGPFLAREMLARCKDSESITPEDLWKQIAWLRDTVASHGYSPVAITNERGHITQVYPMMSAQFPVDLQHTRASINEALDAYYRSHIGTANLDAEFSRLESAIHKAIASRERALGLIEEAIKDGAQAEQYKIMGDLIMAHMGQIVKGVSSAQVVNYYDPSLAKIEIPLDPQLSPRENAERYFKKFRKTRDGAVAAADRVNETRREIEDLRVAQIQLGSADSVERIRNIREELLTRGLLRHETATEPGRKPAPPPFAGMRIRKLISTEGWEILVGENSLSNDYLTTRVASPNDLWFHARSVKGSHVVVRTNNKPQIVPPGVIRRAAELAAAGSDAKHSSLVPVDYTLRKHVRKPRGSAPGYVTYQNEKTVDVTPVKL